MSDTELDFTMMLAGHDAFRRDMARMATSRGTAAFQAIWKVFRVQLHIHHQAEDEDLWPIARAKIESQDAEWAPEALTLLDEMEAEHATIDPLIEKIDAALASDRHTQALSALSELEQALSDHLRHEEREALPMLAKVLTEEEWNSFGEAQRLKVGLKGAGTFFPWLLDDATPARAAAVLGHLPPPVRLLYRALWKPRYQRRHPAAA
jgi:hypothetical protein